MEAKEVYSRLELVTDKYSKVNKAQSEKHIHPSHPRTSPRRDADPASPHH